MAITSVPLSLGLATRLVQVFLLASQAHLYFALRRRFGFALAAAVFIAGVFLIVFSDLFLFDRRFLGVVTREPAFWRPLTAVWTAGSFGAYALYWFWRLAARRRGATAVAEETPDLERRRFLTAPAQAAMAAPFAVAGYGAYIGRERFHVREIEMPLAGLPKDLDGIRLTQLTDIHCGPYLTPNDVARLVAMANETRPHAMLVTGDLISWHGDPLEACLDRLAELRADAGVFACMGNHEALADALELTDRYAARKGVRFLRSATELLSFGDAKLNLAGVDYQWSRLPYLRGAERLLEPDAFNLLLSHNPDVFPEAARLGYDFVVSGHTHGGQVTLELVEQSLNPGRFFTPYVLGEYRLDDTAIYVSPGLGTVNLPMRIGALPEISAFTLRSA